MIIQYLTTIRECKNLLKPPLIRRMRGFSLLEMAMVLAIIGLVMGTILSMTKTLTTSSKIAATQSKEALIKAALINFIATNNRLPCPADPASNTGLEAINAAIPKGCTTSATLFITASTTAPPVPSNSIYIGLVPWATLGLTQDGATDGYNQFFTYKVAAIAISTVPVASLNAYSSAILNAGGLVSTISGLEGAIPIYSSSTFATQINNCTPAGGATYNPCSAVAVVISYGADGYGAFTSGGAQNAFPVGSTYSEELVNASTTSNRIVMHDFSMTPTNPFDDIILPMTSSDLLSPLSSNGTIQPYNAVLNNDFANIVAAISANIALTHSGTPPTSTYTMSTTNNQNVIATLPNSIIYDPWGNQIQYAASGVPSTITFTCTTTTYSSGLFWLSSWGPDGKNSVVPISVPVYLNQLLPVLSASGC